MSVWTTANAGVRSVKKGWQYGNAKGYCSGISDLEETTGAGTRKSKATESGQVRQNQRRGNRGKTWSGPRMFGV